MISRYRKLGSKEPLYAIPLRLTTNNFSSRIEIDFDIVVLDWKTQLQHHAQLTRRKEDAPDAIRNTNLFGNSTAIEFLDMQQKVNNPCSN